MPEQNYVAGAVQDRVRELVSRLQRDYLPTAGRPQPTSWSAAQHAALRGADPFVLGGAPAAWGLIWDGMDERLAGRGDVPSMAERAIFAALVLYAVHQQARTVPMYRKGVSLGAAARSLSIEKTGSGELDAAVLRRFTSVALAREPQQRLHHLRTFIRLLRSEQVPLDHAMLAHDLYRLSWPTNVSNVRTRWARDLYRAGPRTTSGGEADGASSSNSTEVKNGANR